MPENQMSVSLAGFNVRRTMRDYYAFEEEFFTASGAVIFRDFHAARVFALHINQKRDLIHYPELSVSAGSIYVMALISEALRAVLHSYKKEINPLILKEALDTLYESIGKNKTDQTLARFAQEFPPSDVRTGKTGVSEFLDTADGKTIILEELILYRLTRLNPAFQFCGELFEEDYLETRTAFESIIKKLHDFFKTKPVFGPDNLPVLEMLRQPAMESPHSLRGQLDYIRERWGYLLGKYMNRLLGGVDLLNEEERLRLCGPGPSEVLRYIGLEDEPERFSKDLDWMANVVLIAKNAYVWMDQLSRQYGRSINRLDEIPEKELDVLGARGFTALWLIGIWERSRASKRIKQRCGNPEAEASAYSLLEYEIAEEIGGWQAFHTLKDRAGRRGIRMAGDMVPNHMGIDSRMVFDCPGCFISTDRPPFPGYSFNGPNLANDPRAGIFLEDHYYDRTDAAVVFKRVDFHTGDTRYIYHGNDGTSMPWNDTAQLDFLNPETREAVIQMILHVAKNFPVIRLDAAMTLVKRHIQRLWYPEPGSGGAIPSRSEFAVQKESFEKAIPVEFWREVVDRVAAEAPDTLLLAEAFWMLEGYFVRTLGMHRVYNSAFMNMLKNEKNAEYREVILNTLKFNPEILKRFVNFMNNPDEDTAVAQFGRDDKYFGVCVMMCTMPGLPMFGHGQIEGYTEKYGMEYRKAYYQEQPDSGLVSRHEREIFPLLKKRYLFAHAAHFVLYDFTLPAGGIDPNVFAYSNRSGNEKALIVYHNIWAHTAGWIRGSALESQDKNIRLSLSESLGINPGQAKYTIFKDRISQLEYIRKNDDLIRDGLYVDLGAFKYHVFLDFQEKEDESGYYSRIHDYLNGRGAPDIESAAAELLYEPVTSPFKTLLTGDVIQHLFSSRTDEGKTRLFTDSAEAFFLAVKHMEGNSFVPDPADIAEEIAEQLYRIKNISKYRVLFGQNQLVNAGLFCAWLLAARLGSADHEYSDNLLSRSRLEQWQLAKTAEQCFLLLGASEKEARRTRELLCILVSHTGWHADSEHPGKMFEKLLKDTDIQHFLGINRYHDVLWYHKESMEMLVQWLGLTARAYSKESGRRKSGTSAGTFLKALSEAHQNSGCRVGHILSALSGEEKKSRQKNER